MPLSQPGTSRRAFTIIEVLVSVVLITVVALSTVKLQRESREMALYLSNRGKHELSNTLFLGKEAMRYEKEKKDAYTLISHHFKISDSESKEVLEKISRTILLSDPIKLSDETLPVTAGEVILKGDYTARFFHFSIR